MPINQSKDSNGNFIRWGLRGKRYYYKTALGKQRAIQRASLQARAIASRRRQAGSGIISNTIGSMLLESGIKKLSRFIRGRGLRQRKRYRGGSGVAPHYVYRETFNPRKNYLQ
jgi:hypothetical protein